jgi:hypothetical protein
MKYTKIITTFFIIGCGNNDKILSKEEFKSYLEKLESHYEIIKSKKENFFEKKDIFSYKEYLMSIIKFFEYSKNFIEEHKEEKITKSDGQKIMEIVSNYDDCDLFCINLDKDIQKRINTICDSSQEEEKNQIKNLRFKIQNLMKELDKLVQKYGYR